MGHMLIWKTYYNVDACGNKNDDNIVTVTMITINAYSNAHR